MTKSQITKAWVGGLVTFAAGIILALVGVFVMLAFGGTFTQVGSNPNNYTFTPDLTGTFWIGVCVIVVGGLIALAGGIVQLGAWVGALVDSYRLVDRTWFVVLLVGGLLSLVIAPAGFAAMLAYVIAAPESSVRPQTAAPPPVPTGIPTPA